MNTNEPNRAYLTTPEAAQKSGLTKNYIALLARQGKIEGFRIGQAREWFIYTDALEKFLETERKSGPKGPRKKSNSNP